MTVGAADDLEQAFRTMYTQLQGTDEPLPTIVDGEVHLYDVQDYGEQPWTVTGGRPEEAVVRETYHGLIAEYYDESEVETQIAHHDQYFAEQADEVFRDRIYNPPHALHAALPNLTVDELGLKTVVDRLAAYDAEHDATITIAGMRASEAAAQDAIPVQPREYVYGDLAREFPDADYPGESQVMPAEILTPASDATEDDNLYLLLMENDIADGYYPVFFFHRTVSKEKRDAATRLAHELDVIASM